MAPFEASAAAKLRLALRAFTETGTPGYHDRMTSDGVDGTAADEARAAPHDRASGRHAIKRDDGRLAPRYIEPAYPHTPAGGVAPDSLRRERQVASALRNTHRSHDCELDLRRRRYSRTEVRRAGPARLAVPSPGEAIAMIGMVLVTHGRLAAEFVAALEHVVGAQTQIAAVCIGPDDDMEQRRQDILRSIAEVDTGDGAVLLTDMFGGTPSNLAISVMDRGKIEVIAGVNLPMLIKLASLRQTESLERAVLGAQEAGRKYINVASQLLADARR